MLPIKAPNLPNVEPIDTAMPLKWENITCFDHKNIKLNKTYLYSVGNNSTAIQYIRLIPALEKDSNTEDNTRFSIEDVIKYKRAAETPDPKKLTTIVFKTKIVNNIV